MKNLCLNNVEYKRLEDCCIILDNKRKPVTKTARKSGVYPYYGANGIQDYVSDYIFDGVFVLIGEDGSVVNENGNPVVNWAEGKIWVNNHAHIIQEKDGVLLRYIFYFIQTIKIKNLIYGNIPKLTGNNFKSLKISVPSLEIQQKIAEILSAQDKVIELKQKLIDRKKQQKKWLMQNLLTGRIRLKGFEGEWKKISFNIICDKISDGIHGTPKYDLNGDYYFINGNNLRNGKIIITESTKRVNESEYEKYKKTLCNRTILLSINGTIGSTAIYKNEPILLGKSSAYLNIKNKYDFNFIFHAINSNYIQSHFIKKLTGSTIKNLSIDTIKNTQIFIPPIEEQTAIAEILSAQDREIELLEKELEQEKLKKKALMQMLLTGKVRVI